MEETKAELVEPLDMPEEREKSPATVQISKEDMLTAENLSLRLMNTSLQLQQANEQTMRLREKVEEGQQALLVERGRIADKYGVDLDKYEIDATTGTLRLRENSFKQN